MTRSGRRIAFAALVGGLSLAAWGVGAEVTRATFPDDLDRLVHYTTVTRGSTSEQMLTSQATIDAVKAGQPVPNGSRFVLVESREGKLYRYFVMEKGEGWGNDYAARRRTGDWQFQWFWPDRTVNMSENTQRCQSCHQGSADNDFLFTLSSLKSFQPKP